MLTHREISRRMMGVALVGGFALVTILIAGGIAKDASGDSIWMSFWVAAAVGSLVTSVYAYRQQVHQDEGRAKNDPNPIVLGAALGVGFAVYVLIRAASPDIQMIAMGAIFGFWVGAGLGTAAALIPRLSSAPTGSEGERWITDPKD